MASSYNGSTLVSVDGAPRDDGSWKDFSKTSITKVRDGRPKSNDNSLLSPWVARVRAENRGNWKPLSLTMPILLATLLVTLLIVATIELLAQTSQARGGFALSNSIEEIPQYAMIAYQYAPQVVAVLYSMVWSWIDLDVKRMQPWFELSKDSGSSAEDSLMLDYPFTFMAFVPLQAAKKKHWMVFLSGTTLMIVFWAVTPLQASHLDIDKVTLTEPREIISRSRLLPLADQLDLLGPEILNEAYAVAWLNQSYPPFTTSQEAFLPFHADRAELPSASRQNWTATTTRLWTELTCWSADTFQQAGGRGTQWNFLNGQGCNATLNIPTSGNYSMFYVGYTSSAYSGFFLQSPECQPTQNSTHQFLAAWANTIHLPDGISQEYNVTGAYCQADYFKQQVVLAVDARLLTPDRATMEAVGPRERLLDSEFNRTAFEFLVANGMPEFPPPRDFPFNSVIDQHPKLAGRNLTVPISNMVGFALASQDWHAREYSGLETMQQVYGEAHKYLFSLAINRLLVNDTAAFNRTATAASNVMGIVVSRSISAVLEALLLLVALFLGFIMWMVSSAKSSLDVNPSSISRIAEIFGNSPQLLDLLCSVDNADEKSLSKFLATDKFQLTWNSEQQYSEITRQSEILTHHEPQEFVPREYYRPVRPGALRRVTGAAFVSAVVAVIVVLAYLKWAEIKYIGLRRPYSSTGAQQLLESYIPTMLSTMIEPFWVMVNRLICVMQPFNDLWAGGATASTSIFATYTSVPPQFAVWRALKSHHFVLALICGVVFLSNVITVSLPAVFEDGELIAAYPQMFQPRLGATFHNESVFEFHSFMVNSIVTTKGYPDPAHTALANITKGTTLLPWVSYEYFFQPWHLDVNDPADTFSVLTRGYGVKTTCVTTEPAIFPSEATTEPLLDLEPSFCQDSLATARKEMIENTIERPSGPSAIEYLGFSWDPRCEQILTLGWARSEKAEDLNSTTRGSLALCEPVFETAMFQIEVDPSGYVLKHERIGDLEETLGYDGSEAHIERMMADLNWVLSNGSGKWHNNTLTRDWVNHLIVELRDSRSHIDPSEAAPNAKDLLPYIGDVYGRVFANLLALNYHLFEKAQPSHNIEGSRLVKETRLFMDQTAFIITMVILGINVGIAGVFYTKGTVFVLPRMPTSLGSILAYIAPSRIVTDFNKAASEENETHFSFGRFIGRDGLAHIGVDADPHVLPIDPASLNARHPRRYHLFGTRGPQKPP